MREYVHISIRDVEKKNLSCWLVLLAFSPHFFLHTLKKIGGEDR